MTSLLPMVCAALVLMYIEYIPSGRHFAHNLGLRPGQTFLTACALFASVWLTMSYPWGIRVLVMTPLLNVPAVRTAWNWRVAARAACGCIAVSITAERVAQVYPYESMFGVNFQVWILAGWMLAILLLSAAETDKTVLLFCTYVIPAARFFLHHDWNHSISLVAGFWCGFVLIVSTTVAHTWVARLVSRVTNRWI